MLGGGPDPPKGRGSFEGCSVLLEMQARGASKQQ